MADKILTRSQGAGLSINTNYEHPQTLTLYLQKKISVCGYIMIASNFQSSSLRFPCGSPCLSGRSHQSLVFAFPLYLCSERVHKKWVDHSTVILSEAKFTTSVDKDWVDGTAWVQWVEETQEIPRDGSPLGVQRSIVCSLWALANWLEFAILPNGSGSLDIHVEMLTSVQE